MDITFSRRTFAVRFASVLSALAATAAMLSDRASAQGPAAQDRKSTRLNSSHERRSRMPSSA